MLLTQFVPVKWAKKNKKRYEKLGHQFTNFGDTLLISVNDLTKGCDNIVDVQCDICGLVKHIPWNKYLKQHDEQLGDLCHSCCYVKVKATCLERYGVDNGAKTLDAINKQKQTYLNNYRVDNPMRVPELVDKHKQTLLKNYGVDNPSKSETINKRKEKTLLKHYNVLNPMDDFDLRLKAVVNQRQSYKKNGTTVSASKVELKMYNTLCEMFGNEICRHGVEKGIYVLDCELIIDGVKIDIEYDGQYWHNLKHHKDKEIIRDDYMKSHGYKIIRVKGNKITPATEQLKEAIDYLVKGNHSYTEIILDI